MKNNRKTLYWDIQSELKMNKAMKKKNIKKNRIGASKIIRLWIVSPLFDTHVEELNRMLGE